jgi:hypothetical protein
MKNNEDFYIKEYSYFEQWFSMSFILIFCGHFVNMRGSRHDISKQIFSFHMKREKRLLKDIIRSRIRERKNK